MKDKTLQNARHDWVIAEIKKMKLGNPVTEISEKLGVLKSTVSMILGKKQGISMKFFNDFCEAYGFDAGAVNHHIIEQVKNSIISEQKSIEENSQYTSQNISQNIGVEGTNTLSSMPLNKIDMLEQQNYLLAQALANITETNRRLADGLLGMIESRDADKNVSHLKRKAV